MKLHSGLDSCSQVAATRLNMTPLLCHTSKESLSVALQHHRGRESNWSSFTWSYNMLAWSKPPSLPRPVRQLELDSSCNQSSDKILRRSWRAWAAWNSNWNQIWHLDLEVFNTDNVKTLVTAWDACCVRYRAQWLINIAILAIFDRVSPLESACKKGVTTGCSKFQFAQMNKAL